MQIVINIPDIEYRLLRRFGDIGANKTQDFAMAIINGKPLPKGHGNLVDYEELKNNAREYGAYAEATLSHIKPKTIIEADKAESEE